LINSFTSSTKLICIFTGGDASIYPLSGQSNIGTATGITNEDTNNNDTKPNINENPSKLETETEYSSTRTKTSRDDYNTEQPNKKMKLESPTSTIPTAAENPKPENNENEKINTTNGLPTKGLIKTIKLDNGKIATITLQQDDIQRTGAKCVSGEKHDKVLLLIRRRREEREGGRGRREEKWKERRKRRGRKERRERYFLLLFSQTHTLLLEGDRRTVSHHRGTQNEAW
jgi:hypothetical protein